MKGMSIMMKWEEKAKQLVDTRYGDLIIRLMKVDYKYIVNTFEMIILRARDIEESEAIRQVEHNCCSTMLSTINAYIDSRNSADAVKAIIAFSKIYEASMQCIEECRSLVNGETA